MAIPAWAGIDDALVRFDRKTWIFLGSCIALFFLFVALKWHNSSMGFWNTLANDGSKEQYGLLAGTPRPIRSDEWQVNASFMLSQYHKGFPVENKALGAGKTPLAFGLPARTLVSMVKPAFWGYFLLDIERGYSWHWNFKLFPFLIVSFLLLMLLTGNHFLLSVTGSLWLFLSSATQWWSIYTELFTYGMACVIAVIYLLMSTRLLHLAISGIVLVLAAYSYAMILYPAYMVPLAYALLALIIGYLIYNRGQFLAVYKTRLAWRIGILAASGALTLLLLFLFYTEIRETLHTVMNTVYPGRRSETGGDFSFYRLFTDDFSLFLDESKIPPEWGNICELSSFLMLSLVPSLILVADYFKKKKRDYVLLALIVFQAVMFWYMIFGFPGFLSKLTFLNVSPSNRVFFIFGFVNVLLTILFLARHRIAILPERPWIPWVTLGALGIIIYVLHQYLNSQINGYFSDIKIWTSTVLFTALNWLVLQFHRGKVYQSVFIGLLALLLLPNLRINPLNQGLGAYMDNRVYKTIESIRDKEPDAGWVVFGKYTTPNFVKAAGANCFNGVQFAPPFADLHILDPQMKYDSVYNRFAHIGFTTLIQPNDSIEFALKQNDLYMIRMDPCSPRLTRMGIKYVMFTYEPVPVELDCMEEVAILPNHYIYRRREG